MSSGAAVRRHVPWKSGTLSLLESGAPQDPVILLLHGVGSGAESWRDQFEELPRFGLRVIAWDQPGYGESSPLAMPAPLPDDYADAVMVLADALKLSRFVLLGHSLGALIAGAVAARRGGARLSKLILASPTTGFANAAPEVLRAKIQQRIDDMTALGPARLAQQRAKALLSPHASAESVERVRNVMAALKPEGYIQAVRMLARGDLLAMAPRITQPSLVLSGTADLTTPEASCRRIAAALPQARYVPLPGLGHACYIEDAHAFDSTLINFLHPENS